MCVSILKTNISRQESILLLSSLNRRAHLHLHLSHTTREFVLLAQPSVHLAAVVMASEDSESSASFDMLTPDISVSASSQQSETPEAMDESVRELLHDDDLALGRELLMKALDERSDGETGSAPESDESTRVLPRKEVVPDQSGEYVDNKLNLRVLRLMG